MAYIKHRAIHVTPRAHLKYILDPGKNEEMKFSTAICCTNDFEAVCEDFRQLYEMFSDDKFDNYRKSKNNHVRIHSYIQSFDESVSAETAHQIGVEWTKAMFGENRPVIISTHTNTGHCHNHIAVCPFDVYGNRWLATKKTYQLARDVSDRICLEHGLSIIENPKQNKSLTYAEWFAKRNGSSLKTKMADIIDRLIIDEAVTDIDSLILKMKERGYIFTNEKRLIAKPQGVKYGCCISKLGYGYSMEMLQIRIENKQNEFIGRKISAYLGMQVELAVTIRENQRDVYRSQSNEYNDNFITIARNYATALADNSLNKKALEVLTECEFASEGCVSVNHARLIYDIGAMYARMNKISAAVKKYNAAFSELSELGCYDELSVRKIAAAEIMRKFGYEYPKEWETGYLE